MKKIDSDFRKFKKQSNKYMSNKYDEIKSKLEEYRKSLIPTAEEDLIYKLSEEIKNCKDKKKLSSLHLKRALVYIQTGKIEEAFNDLKEPNDESFLYNFFRARVFEEKGDFLEAAKSYRKSIDLFNSPPNPIEQEFYKNLEKLNSKLNLWSGYVKFEEKLEEITNTISNFFNFNTKQEQYSNNKYISLDDLCNLCANAYLEASYYQDAIYYFTELINHGLKSKSDKVGISYYNRGLCHYLLFNNDDAINDFNQL